MIIENGSSITKRKIKSHKSIVLICAAIALFSDLLAMLALVLNGFDLLNYLAPLVIAVVDALFFVTVLFSDFRFRYTLAEFLIYVFIILSLSFVSVFLNLGFGEFFGLGFDIAMTKAAVICWYAVHGIICIAIVISSLYAVRFTKSKRTVLCALSVILVLVLGASCYLYYSFLSNGGFFGQGDSSAARTLVYNYDEKNDSYKVTGVLDSEGNTIIIPAEFNDKTVTSVDCSIFTTEGITTVKFEGETIQLENADELASVSDNFTIYTDKAYADTYKQIIYEAAAENSSSKIYSLANSIVPEGLADDEIYLSFSVSSTVYELLEGDVPTIWYGKKGDKIDLSEYYSAYPYFAHTDKTSDSDLYWSYVNMDGYILDEFTLSNGTVLSDTVLNASVTGVEITFTSVYSFSFGADNDDLFTLSTAYTQITVDGKAVNYRYTVLDAANTLLTDISRDGFNLTWYYSSGSSNRKKFTSLSTALQSGGDGIVIYPQWELIAPEVTLSADNASVVYGNNVTLTASASSSADGILFRYNWTASDGTSATGTSVYGMSLPTPSQSGTYKVMVTAYSNTATSLTSSTSEQISITIAKKELTVSWTLPESLVYSGYVKTLQCSLDESQFVGDDVVSVSFDSTEILNAANYTFTAELDSASQKKYTLANDVSEFTITPYSLTLTWKGDSFVYNGYEQMPEAKADGLGDDGTIEATVVGAKNAGNHTAEASITDTNYILANSEYDFEITPYELTLTWTGDSFVYNGYEQMPEAKADGLGDDGTIEATVVGAKNAGNHTAEASITDTNYTLVNSEYDFEITPYSLTLTWDGDTFVYNGYEQAPEATAKGVGDDGDIAVSVAGATLVGSYDALASITDTNYELYNSTYAFAITQRALEVIYQSVTKTYDGLTADYDYEISGLADTDSESEVLTLTAEGTAIGAVDRGDYILTGTFVLNEKGANYNITITDAAVSILAKAITLTWGSNTFVYCGYDQIPQAEGIGVDGNALTIAVSGEAADAGSYTATASIDDTNYTLVNSEYNYTITPYELTLTWDGDTFVYNGYEQAPAATATGVGNDGSIAVTVAGAKNAGNHTAYAGISDGNYTLANSEYNFTITPRELTLTWDGDTFVYNGYEQAPAATATGVGNDGSIAVTVAGAKNAGNHTAYASITDGNYTLANSTYDFEITAYSLTLTWSGSSFVYNGYEQAPTATAAGLGDDGTIVATVNGGKNVGSYTAYASITDSNYTLTNSTYSFEITAYSLTLTWSGSSFVYNGSEQIPTATAIGVGDDGVLAVTVSDGHTNVGSYTATASITDSNYTLVNSTYNFAITPYGLTLTWSGDTFVYSAAEQIPTASVNDINGNALTVTVSGGQTDVGSYTATATITDSNYELLNSEQVFTITPYSLTITWTGDTFVYSGSERAPAATATGLGNDGDITVTVVGATDAGSHTAYASITNGNYEIANSTYSFTIMPYELTLTWTGDTFVYNGYEQAPTATATGLGNDGDITVTIVGAKDVGTHTAYASITNGNYTLANSTYSFTITAYELTLTWSGSSLVYNGYEQAPTATATGLGNDGAIVATVVGGKNVGSYTATASITNSNYTLANSTYNFEITAYSLTLVWSNTTLTYSGSAQAPTATATGVGGDVLTITVSGAATNAGTYTATASIDNDNYTISNSTRLFTINPYSVTATWSGTTLTYSGSAQAPTATVNGVDGIALAVSYTYYSAAGTALSGAPSEVGSYSVTATISNSNYTLSNSIQQFSITAATNSANVN